MNHKLESIQTTIAPLRNKIINHKIYSSINDVEDLKIFMQYHVFAVWDFMSLLKTLQVGLTCTNVPWFPKGSADTRYLINEIVVGEESDVDSFGNRKSHFEIYLDAMNQCGADTALIKSFLLKLIETGDFERAYQSSQTPYEVQNFVNFTFDVIRSNKTHVQSAVFTFGREDLIPEMFISMVQDLHDKMPETVSIFKYYLERHIEVDGDHHSHLALQMTSNLCEDNLVYWTEAEQFVVQSLQMRLDLWDAAYQKIVARSGQSH
jgi:hypothetical protein